MKTYKLIFLLIMVGLSGCQKFLDEKPQKSLVVPVALSDFQALLANETASQRDPRWGEISTDDCTYDDAVLATKEYAEQMAYLWDKGNVFGTDLEIEWLYHYRMVYHANTALEGLGKIERTNFNQAQWDKIKGEALFFRAKCHLDIENIWALAYDPATALTDPGIPLRLNTDFNQVSVRATQLETYKQIVDDLKAAIDLLPVVSVHVVRPSKAAALALLARVYLFMRDYSNCWHYANESLKLKSDLVDYNTLSQTASYPMAAFNKEVIYHSYVLTSMINSRVSASLYQLYQTDDLRKKLFFKDNGGTYSFKGSYYGRSTFFSGIAVDEVYLMRAEGYARSGDIVNALKDLNILKVNRWKTAAFMPYTAATKEEALALVLAERRRELAFRALRWPDVKRLNKEGAGISMTRTNYGTANTLVPNEVRFALPIPQRIIELTGMPQNPR